MKKIRKVDIELSEKELKVAVSSYLGTLGMQCDSDNMCFSSEFVKFGESHVDNGKVIAHIRDEVVCKISNVVEKVEDEDLLYASLNALRDANP